MNARGIARVGMLAVGLGIGASLAFTPVIASADSSSDWLSSIDSLLSGGPPTAGTSDLNLAISIDGYSLLSDGSATATSGQGDIAIAFGDGASATATGGSGDFASASGTDSVADALNGSEDSATAIGNYAQASADDGNNDTATSIGLGDSGGGIANSDFGDHDQAFVVDTGADGDFANAGGLIPGIVADNDAAIVVGTASSDFSGYDPDTVFLSGDHDLAAVFGNALEAVAAGSNGLTDIVPSL